MRALLVDAAGTLLDPAEPVAVTYARFAGRRGGESNPAVVGPRFREAMSRARPLRRGHPDWRPFWAEVVRAATGSDDPELLEELYAHYALPEAWRIADGAEACARSIGRVVVVSNWDLRLRGLLDGLGVTAWLPEQVISAEVGVEKPDPAIFAIACDRLGVQALDAVHVGNSLRADVAGARSAGCTAWHWGTDVHSFAEVASRFGVGPP